MTVYSKAKEHQLLASKQAEKMALLKKPHCREWWGFFYWLGGCCCGISEQGVELVFLKATIHVLKSYPTELLVVFADEAI